jgi:hypothetical protein
LGKRTFLSLPRVDEVKGKTMKLRFAGVAAVLVAFALPISSAAANSGVVGQWHFDEGSGSVAVDSSGNNDTGNLFPVTGAPHWVPGRFGSALSFDGKDGVQIPDNGHSVLDTDSSAVSVSAWVRSDSRPEAYRYIIAKGASGCEASSYGLYTGPEGGLSFYISNGSASAKTDYDLSPDAGGAVWDGGWHLVVGTFDGRTLRLYLDGVQIGAGTPFPGPIAYARTSSTDLDIGYYPARSGCRAGGFAGSIDEPTVWNFALDAVQVAQLEPAGGSTSPGAQPPTPTQPPSRTTGTGNGTRTGTGGGTGTRNRNGTGIGSGTKVGNGAKGRGPVVSHLRISRSTLAIAKRRHPQGKRGREITISYTVTRAGSTDFTVRLPQPGVRRRGKCVAVPRGTPAPHAQRCTRYRVLGRFAHADRAGANHFAFTAVTILQLRPHRYLLDATPQAHGVRGTTVSIPFTIKR